MSAYWEYENIGASVTDENRILIEKILEYIGYRKELGWHELASDNDYNFHGVFSDIKNKEKNVYGCMHDYYWKESEGLAEAFMDFEARDLFNLLNALFPGTIVFTWYRQGSSAGGMPEHFVKDRLFEYSTRTLHCYDYSYDSQGFYDLYDDRVFNLTWKGKKWKQRCDPGIPDLKYVEALIEKSCADSCAELTALLIDLERRIKEHRIVYEYLDDKREPGKEYDIDEDWGNDYEEDDYEEDDYEDVESAADSFKAFFNGELTAEERADFITRFDVGKTVRMGNYGGEIVRWKVLAAEGDKRTMIAVKGQDAVCFNKSRSDGNKWEESYIRTWLNDTYYNTAFSAEEQAMIVAGPTGDKVWLLSVDEAEAYFEGYCARVCYATGYAKENGAYTENGAGWWWLRSPGSGSDYAAYVNYVGLVDSYGLRVHNVDAMARPVVAVSVGF